MTGSNIRHYIDDESLSEIAMRRDFHTYLLEKRIFDSSAELQDTVELALKTGARMLGFLAEIEANRWL